MGDFQQVLKVVSAPQVLVSTIAPPRTYTVPLPPPVSTFATPTPYIPVYDYIAPKPSVLLPPTPTSFNAPLNQNTSSSVASESLINPLITFQNKDQPYYIPYSYISSFLTAIPSTINVSTVNAYTVNANHVNAVSTLTQELYTNYGEAVELFCYDKFTLDTQVLTADATSLLLNGVPLVTTENLSSIQDWSFEPAISTIQANNNDLTGVKNGYFSTITAHILTVDQLITNVSTTVEYYESTFKADIKQLNVSSINANVGVFSTLTAQNIIFPPAEEISTLQVEYLTVDIEANINKITNNTTFTTTPAFNNGGNFYGTRPNFTTGINTSGANNFNYTNIDNIQNVSGKSITIQANDTDGTGGEYLGLVADGGTFTAFYPNVNIVSQYGGGGQVNITAERPSLLVGVPSQNVNITAKGGNGYYTGIPVGGAVNTVANAGTVNLLTTTGVLGSGAIHDTAYSFINGIYTVPGYITQSAGCIEAYSGLTVPIIPLYGVSFYSALTCLSLTAGVTPATTSYPGTVFLRGDNGTKVVNGLYTDSLNNNVGYDLNIESRTTPVLDTSNRNINLNSYNNINLNTDNGGQVYINGTPYSGGGGGWSGNATSDLNMNTYKIFGSNSGNMLGVYQPFKFVYEPPTATGQFAEFAIQAHPQDAGVIYDLRYGVDMQGGYGYLKCEWTGYIVVPIKIFGQDIALEGGETVHINTANAIYNNTGGSFNVSSVTTNITASNDIYISSITGNINLVCGSGGGGIKLYDYMVMTGSGNPIYMGGNTIECQGGLIAGIATLYFNNGGNIASANTAGINYLDINTPTDTGSGNARLRIVGSKGRLDFDDNVTLSGNGSNQVGMFNQYGSIYLDSYQNVHLNGGGSHRGSEDQIQVHGLIYSDSRIYTGAVGQGFLQQNGSGFIETRVDYGAYGGLNMNGYFQVCQTGTTSAVFTVPSDTNANMSYNNGSGGFGIGTTSPAYRLDVNGDARVANSFVRNLNTTPIAQPVFQQGATSGTGSSGSVSVTIPTAYTSVGSYQVFVTHTNSSPPNTSVVRNTSNAFTIYWTNAGGGTQPFDWMTAGT